MVTTSRSMRTTRGDKDGRALRNKNIIPSYQEISSEHDDDDDDDDDEDEDSCHSSSDDMPLATRRTSRSNTTPAQAKDSAEKKRKESVKAKVKVKLQTKRKAQAGHTKVPKTASGKRSRDLEQEDSDSEHILYEVKDKKRKLRTPTSISWRQSVKPSKRSMSSPGLKPQKTYDIVAAGGIVPKWTSLPYLILLRIFEYAAYPAYDRRTFQVTGAYDRVLGCSRLCRAFSEPALTALYKCPALIPMSRAFKLVNLLNSSEQSLMTYNYQYKIEAIHMEVSQTAMYTLPGQGLLDLHSLLFPLPRLSSLEFYHVKDLPPYRQLDHNIKWVMPTQVFAALEHNIEGVSTRLKNWRWNARLTKNIAIEEIIAHHQKEYFAHLEKVAICNYQVAKPLQGETTNFVDPDHEQLLAEALNALSKLNHLVLESSTLVNASLMPLLPPVAHLEIINCWDITSEDLLTYLMIHGSHLRHLKLDHNISLNLSFLSQLGSLCPNLETLKMDMTYFSVHQSYDNSEPAYDCLLEIGETPNWPASIQTIELLHLRQWASEDKAVETAQRFFQSLLDSAEKLRDLRCLTIKGTLNIAWRDRVSFRERWYEPLHNVFLRVCGPPKVPSTMQEYRAWKLQQTKQRIQHSPTSNQAIADDSEDTTPLSRRRRAVVSSMLTPERSGSRVTRSLRTRAEHHYREESTSAAESSVDDGADVQSEAYIVAPSQRKRKRRTSRELKILKACAGIDSPLHTLNDDNVVESDIDSKRAVSYRQSIQGMCHTVDIQIDNLRPAENQYKESDFLDSEPEGDEDYTGRDLEFD